ncbi:DUF2975 domain-containing protein [Flavobacterium ardleyense]|uniref:DUF2975 domain-containing protein n=1 Tax=Flavobacterium ardleyense TaxID=2038737 RepID=A0ABW5Z9K2_9FLAO
MKKLNLLRRFLLVLIVISIAGMVGNIGTKYFSHSNYSPTNFQFWLSIVANILFYIGLYYAHLGFTIIKKQNSFTNKSNFYFNKSALLLIVSSITHTLLITLNYSTTSKEVSAISLAFYFLVIILGLFIYAISDIVQLGRGYQEENELTI